MDFPCYTLFFVLYIIVHSCQADQVCGGKPADVVFVLDSSASIGIKDFRKQIQFTADVVDLFDIGPNKTRVGVTLFSTSVYPAFGLSNFRDKEEMEAAINRISYFIGGTNTDKALRYIREHEFKENYRPNIPQIAIILTDGQSYDRDKTIREAQLTHAAGINIFVIGIGLGVDKKELSALASNPDESYLFEIGNYSALQNIKDTLAIKTCKVEHVATTLPPPEVINDAPVDPSQCLQNMLIGIDTNGVSTSNTRTVLSFLADLNDKLAANPGRLRSSQIMTECAGASRKVRSKRYAPLVRKLRYLAPKRSRTTSAFGLLIINSDIADPGKIRGEVRRGEFIGFHLVVMNVGSPDREDDISRFLGALSENSNITRVFTIPSYSKMATVLESVSKSLREYESCSTA